MFSQKWCRKASLKTFDQTSFKKCFTKPDLKTTTRLGLGLLMNDRMGYSSGLALEVQGPLPHPPLVMLMVF